MKSAPLQAGSHSNGEFELDGDQLPIVQVAQLDIQPAQEQWLIEGLWARSAIGLIGGVPKSCKTWLGLDMAVSVASGTPALDHFPIHATGPALVYLAEDGLPQVRGRIEALCRHRAIDMRDLALHVITAPAVRLDLAIDQGRLARTIAALKPRMVLLDPLVRMHRLDENSAAEISGLLGYIRELQRRFDVAVVLVHHASKKQRAHPGQALRGSSDLHAIGDSNAYLAHRNAQLILTIEHRSAASKEPMAIELITDHADETTHLRVCDGQVVVPVRNGDGALLSDQILTLLAQPGDHLPRTVIRERLRVNNDRLGKVLEELDRQGRIRRTKKGWCLSDPLLFRTKPGETEAGSAAVQPAEG